MYCAFKIFTSIKQGTRGIDSFHIVSAHVPNCLVPRYLREITLEGATFIQRPIHYTMGYEKDEKKNKFANKDKTNSKNKMINITNN